MCVYVYRISFSAAIHKPIYTKVLTNKDPLLETM